MGAGKQNNNLPTALGWYKESPIHKRNKTTLEISSRKTI